MPLAPGSRIGAYEIAAQIGAGGMGEVYRATDTNLKRQVAIKVLPESLAGDADRLARFQREAEALAALSHPHIAQIHGLERSGGVIALVMELVEGRTLEARIAAGPIPLREALAIAAQIADALDAAHRKGITHRDLKPANVQITKGGVKLLDFGLAKVQNPVELSGETVTRALTGAGTILGTLNYMSPEQLQGREADARSDIFALGLVLHEMITGKRVFDGSSPASVIAAILERPVPALEPESLHRIVSTCLAKDPDDRFQTARDLKRAITWSEPGRQAAQELRQTSSHTWPVALVVGAVALLAAAAVVAWRGTSSAGASIGPDLTLSIVPPASPGLSPVGHVNDRSLISPDGLTVLYRDGRSLGLDAHYWIRRLDSLTAQEVGIPFVDQGTRGFWSSDSTTLAFDSGGALWRMRVPDGVPERIASTVGPMVGGSWSDDGAILFVSVVTRWQMFVVAAGGGEARALTLPGLPEGSYFQPEFLPGANEFLVGFETPDGRDVEIYLATLRGDEAVDPVLLMTNETTAMYTPARSGQLLFVRDDVLYAQQLDLRARRLLGQPEEVLRGVATTPGNHTPAFSVSRDGVLAWRPGTEALTSVTTFDRNGNEIGISGPPGLPLSVKLSPDERRLLIAEQTEQVLVEPDRPGQLVVSRSRDALTTLWTPSGDRLLVPAPGRVFERPVSGGDQRALLEVEGLTRLEDVSPDGAWVLFTSGALATSVQAVRLDGSEPPRTVLDTGERVFNTRFSPDGRWIVFEAHPTTGGGEGLYVQPFPGPGLRRQISPRGQYPLWRKDGQEIVFLDQGRIWSIGVGPSEGELTFSDPRPLFAVRGPGGVLDVTPMAVSRDGSRFYIMQPLEQPDTDVIHVRTGWGTTEQENR